MTDCRHLLFLSHAGVDSDAAIRLAERLEANPEAKEHGLSVWIDKKDLRTGEGWKSQLENALQESTAFAVYIGSGGVMNWVRDEVDVALDRAHERDGAYPVIPVLSKSADLEALPGFLSQYQGVVDVENEPAEFQKLIRGVLNLEAREAVALEKRPFQGLGAFTSDRAHLFHGRRAETNELVELLRVDRLIMVVGDSGSGKSSLIKAGLVPAFLGGALAETSQAEPDETIWHAVETRPKSRPFRQLADSVNTVAGQLGKDLATRTAIRKLAESRDPEDVRSALIESGPPDAKILLVVDQFEELLTLADEEIRAPYVDVLMSIADPHDDRIRVALSMRRDYYNLTSEFEAFYKRLESEQGRARYFLRKMTEEGLREAIERPLHAAGVESAQAETLATAVLRDIGDQPSDLALLEMALTKTWDGRDAHEGDLLRAYENIGRVDGALAKAAEAVFQGRSPKNDPLNDAERGLAEALFIRLVRLGDTGGATRRVAARSEFDDPTWAVAQKLAEPEFERLVVVRGDTVEIAHEAMVTQWPRYQRWLQNRKDDPRADDKRSLDLLIDDASGWKTALENGEDGVSRLASGGELERFRALASHRRAWLSESELEFVTQSAEREDEKRAAKRLEDEFITEIVDSDVLREYLEWGDALWPAHPERLTELQELRRQADGLLSTAADKRDVLTRLTDRLSKAPTPRLRWQRDTLQDLIPRIAELGDPETGLLASLDSRIRFARTVRGLTVEDHADNWDRTIAQIGLSNRYGGLEIEPQIGLIPIGEDPASGLFEFLHLQTHEGPLIQRLDDGRLPITEATGIVLVLLPGNTFWMGAQNESPDRPNYDENAEIMEMPPHEVTLSPFLISKNLMTQGQWLRFTGHNPSHYQPGFAATHDYEYTLLHPVEEVTWAECQDVLRKLDLALPTEAQWEYAARGDTSTVYWTGDDKEDIRAGAHLLYNEMKLPRHAPIGSYLPNGFGLYDVIGNLWEFTADQYGSYELDVEDRTGRRKVDGNRYLVIRGCSFFNSAEQARIAYRTDDCEEGKRESWMGVRPVRPLAGNDGAADVQNTGEANP